MWHPAGKCASWESLLPKMALLLISTAASRCSSWHARVPGCWVHAGWCRAPLARHDACCCVRHSARARLRVVLLQLL
jgi:hypothetical protein